MYDLFSPTTTTVALSQELHLRYQTQQTHVLADGIPIHKAAPQWPYFRCIICKARLETHPSSRWPFIFLILLQSNFFTSSPTY
jgi:hypothetical protein